jgi:MFS family permease
VLATAAFGAAEAVSGDGFASWGWRVPFLLSLVLVMVGLAVRLKIVESPEFQAVKDTGTAAKAPLYEVIRHHPLNVLLAIGCCLAPFLNFYLFATFVLTYGSGTLGLSSTSVLVVVAVVALVEVGTIPCAAWLSDRFGRARVFLIGTVLFALFGVPFFVVTQAAPTAIVLGICSFVGLSLIHPLMYGPMAALFAELFPPEVRYSGASLGYQLGAILGGGFAPLILTALLSAGIGATGAISPYMIVVAAVTFVSVFYAGRRRGAWGSRHNKPAASATGMEKEDETIG